jgi:hypothetical protein
MLQRQTRAMITWAVGLGLSAIAMVPSARSQPVSTQDLDRAIERAVNTLSLQIREAKGDLQKNIDAVNERLNRHIRDDHAHSQSETVRPPISHSAPPRVVRIERHYYYQRYWCPPPWWGPWW